MPIACNGAANFKEPAMLEEAIDPRPLPDNFSAFLAQSAAGCASQAAGVDALLSNWNDREGTWTNLRNIEHWIARSRR
jgi:hypothetical protein